MYNDYLHVCTSVGYTCMYVIAGIHLLCAEFIVCNAFSVLLNCIVLFRVGLYSTVLYCIRLSLIS